MRLGLRVVVGVGVCQLDADVSKIHGFLGAILSFLIVFRSNAGTTTTNNNTNPPPLLSLTHLPACLCCAVCLAYDRYYDGRKVLGRLCCSARGLVTEVYATALAHPHDPDSQRLAYALREHIRRKINILLALIRQERERSRQTDRPSPARSFVDCPPGPWAIVWWVGGWVGGVLRPPHQAERA